ncbi:MAG: CoA ester lyase [Pseudomonadota bacterium]
METNRLILRSVLYLPANNERALAKLPTLNCDAVIFDLEDSVAPEAKSDAREQLRGYFQKAQRTAKTRAIRINGLDTRWFTEDLMAARACCPDAIVIPKVSSPHDLQLVEDALGETDAPPTIKLWAMIETPMGVLQVADIAGHAQKMASRLQALVLGTNDLFKEAALTGDAVRSVAHPWFMQIILAAKANAIASIDGVYNDFQDLEAFDRECGSAAAIGFDGKTLIHPAQILAANRNFSPGADALDTAQQIVDAFDLPENADKGVISLGGKMVERLHLEQAEALLARQAMIEVRAKEGEETL